jgi:hypothetical protein
LEAGLHRANPGFKHQFAGIKHQMVLTDSGGVHPTLTERFFASPQPDKLKLTGNPCLGDRLNLVLSRLHDKRCVMHAI